MNRKIVIKKCEHCRYMHSYNGILKLDGYSGVRDFCENPENGNSPEEVDESKIPEWCPLEIDK